MMFDFVVLILFQLLNEEDYVEEEQESENPPKRQKMTNQSNKI